MLESFQPTPYIAVNEVLHNFLVRIQSCIGNHFRGMYLYGSLALGDFDPHGSDIDFIVVTDTTLSDDLFLALRDMHAQFAKNSSPWAEKIEAAYIPQAALHQSGPTTERYPQIEKGGTLLMDHLEIGWIFQRYTLREHGVIVEGPDPRQMFEPVDPDDMRRAVIAIPNMWLENARSDPSWLVWVQQRGNQAFVVLTLCRLLYTLETGAVVSKPQAARWAQKTLDPRWVELINRSLAGQHNSAQTSELDVNDTVALIQHTVDRHQRLYQSQ